MVGVVDVLISMFGVFKKCREGALVEWRELIRIVELEIVFNKVALEKARE